jgi:hypothetical protein
MFEVDPAGDAEHELNYLTEEKIVDFTSIHLNHYASSLFSFRFSIRFTSFFSCS